MFIFLTTVTIFYSGGGIHSNCDHDEVRCGNGECIPDHYWCDGYTDCIDDELHCKIIITTKTTIMLCRVMYDYA